MQWKYQMKRMMGVVLLGMGAGFFCVLFRQEQLLLKTGFLDIYTLSPMKYLEIDCGVLLGYVLKQRLFYSLILSVLSTTYLGIIVCYVYMSATGVALGMLLAGGILRYGWKGFLLIIVSLLPHQFILFPGFLLLTYVACSLCRFLYFQDMEIGIRRIQKRTVLGKHILMLLICNIVVIIGCYVESYVNPQFLKMVLKLF